VTSKALVLTVMLLALASCRHSPSVTIRVVAEANPIVSGSSTTITASVKRGDRLAYSTTVNFSASGCGTVSPGSATTPSDSSSAWNSDASVSFTGNSPTSTCIGTITATAEGARDSCRVTVTPQPVTQPVAGAGRANPVVAITPEMKAVPSGGFEWTYLVSAPAGYYINSINIGLEAQADISAGKFTDEKPDPPFRTTRALFTYGEARPAQEERVVSFDTVTVETPSAKVGVATFDVAVHNPSSRGQVLHVLFKGLPGPK
jgi:hypothetical protein